MHTFNSPFNKIITLNHLYEDITLELLVTFERPTDGLSDQTRES
jgi:hypothetical protein